MKRKGDLIVGLDIGTTKICTVVAEITDHGLEVVGVGVHPSQGLRKGVVVNIERTVEAVRKSVDEAETMAGVQIRRVVAGIAGPHIRAVNSRGVIPIKDREVTRDDVEQVLEAARAVAIPADRELLHVLPREFIVDEQGGIKDPLGMSGVRLEAEVHIITGAVSSVQNLVKSINRAGLEVEDLVLQPLASAEAVLTPDEKELGVALVDIGGGTTDIAVFVEGGIRHTAVLAIGGNHFTNDIAIGLRTPGHDAEKIKLRHGCASTILVRDKDMIEVPSVGGRPPRFVPRRMLAEVVEPRAEELFALVGREIKKTGYGDLVASGVVLTGGSSAMEGIVETAEKVLEFQARRAGPGKIGGLSETVSSPAYATAVGLVMYARRVRQEGKGEPTGSMMGRMTSRMRGWVKALF